MNKRTILNIALVVVVVVLALVVYFQPGGNKAKPTVKLTQIKPAAVKKIRITQPKQPPLKLVRDSGGWKMTAPVRAPADASRITSVLANLDEASAAQFLAAQAKLAQYGLKSPKLTLWVNGSKKLVFGSSESLNRHRYIKIGHTIHAVNDRLYSELAGDPMQFASKHLLPRNAEITAVELPDQTVTLGKNGEWRLAPKNPNISADTIQKFVDAWKNARAISVSTWKSQQSQNEVAIDLKNHQKPLRLAIVKRKGSFVLARPDLKLKYDMPESQKKAMLVLKPQPKPKTAPGGQRKASVKSNSGG